MFTKIFSVVLAIFVIALTVISCVSLPLDESLPPEESFPYSSQSEPPVLSEPDESQDISVAPSEEPSSELSSDISEESSAEDISDEPSDESSAEESSEEPSEESSEEFSEPVIDLPYPVLKEVNVDSKSADFDKAVYDEFVNSDIDIYFDNSVFVGNSIATHLLNFFDKIRYKSPDFMGESSVLYASSWSARHDLRPITDDSVHLKYKGKKMKCCDAVKAMGASKVFLTVMALNDIGLGGKDTCVQETFDNMVKLIESIRTTTPNVEIILLSSTYIVYDRNNGTNNHNGNYSELNNKMLDYATANGIDFVDVSTCLMDGNVLADRFCRDNYCHLTNAAYTMWVEQLRNYAYLKQNEAYKNPDSMPVYTKNPN